MGDDPKKEKVEVNLQFPKPLFYKLADRFNYHSPEKKEHH
jgi:hypothetical protein